MLLTNKLISLKAALVAGNFFVKSAIFRTETDLNATYVQEMEGFNIQSRAQWLELGKVPSWYFFSLNANVSLNAQLNLFITMTVLKFFLRQTSLVLTYIFTPDLFPVTKLMIYYLTCVFVSRLMNENHARAISLYMN